jgi:ABC-2 type transport system ATP-binding protein
MTAAVEVRGLTKRFGPTTALDQVDLVVPAGSIFGFLGPNGAGKTTMLRILTGLARPTAGSALLLGRKPEETEIKRRIGFLPDVPGFYGWMTAPEFLHFAGRLFGIDRRTLSGRAGDLLELAGLAGVTTRVGGFSRGMKQRLGVAQALINAPELLLLDEPTSALDPIGRREVLEMIAALRGRTTVFFSTHILADVERVCDTVAILDRGRVAASAAVAELKRRSAADRLSVEIEGDAAAFTRAIAGAPWLGAVEHDGSVIRLRVVDLPAALRAVPEAIAAAKLGLRRFEVAEVSLEEAFVEIVQSRGRAS